MTSPFFGTLLCPFNFFFKLSFIQSLLQSAKLLFKVLRPIFPLLSEAYLGQQIQLDFAQVFASNNELVFSLSGLPSDTGLVLDGHTGSLSGIVVITLYTIFFSDSDKPQRSASIVKL
jgi:hypothetical protein